MDNQKYNYVPEAEVTYMEKAKWTMKVNDICYWIECSNCGGWPPKSYWGHAWYPPYCPHCGKPMDEPEPEEDDYYMEG